VNAVTKAARGEVKAALERAAGAIDVGGITDKEVIDLVRRSPMARHAAAEAALAKQQRRIELRALIAEEHAASERDGADLQRRHREAVARRDAKAQELRLAEQEVNEAATAIAVRGRFRDHMLGRYEAELETLIPREITEFGARCDAAWNDWRTAAPELPHRIVEGLVVYSGSGDGPPASPEYSRKRTENAAALDRHRLIGESFGAAAKAAQALTFPEGSEELRAALESIWDRRLELAKAARAARGS
jgi:hypothetical protein